MAHGHPVIPGATFVDPKVLARIANLDLLARTVVDGFINGIHKTSYLGSSVDFAEHRGYMPGDDIRRIDWRLYARTDRYYVKEFEADSNANFSVLFDVSKSMAFGSQGLTKLDYARYLAASMTYFASRQRDRVGIVTFDSEILERVPPSAKHVDVVLHTIDRIRAGRPGQLGDPLFRMTEFFKRRGILAIISDFYEEPDTILDAVKRFRYQGHDVMLFHILDPAELDFRTTRRRASRISRRATAFRSCRTTCASSTEAHRGAHVHAREALRAAAHRLRGVQHVHAARTTRCSSSCRRVSG